MRAVLRSGMVFIMILTLMTPVCAAEGTAGDYFYGISTKFGRGLGNVVSSLAEIPCTTKAEMQNRGVSGLATGFGKGFLFMLRRILVGVDEVATFVIPMEPTLSPVCHETV